jgi:hypothetical protein
VDWDIGFKTITADKLYLITAQGSSSMMSNSPAGRKWIVTKSLDMKGKLVCWCIPVDVKMGEMETVTFGEKNMVDLRAAYDNAMQESGAVGVPDAAPVEKDNNAGKIVVVFQLTKLEDAAALVKTASTRLPAVQKGLLSLKADEGKNRIVAVGSQEDLDALGALITKLAPQ